MGLEDKTYMAAIQANIFDSMPYTKLRGYLRWRLARYYSEYLPRRLQSAVVASRTGHVPTLEEESRPARPEMMGCYFATVDALKQATSKLYIDHYFDQGTIQTISLMLQQVRTAFAKDLTELTWMDPRTKVAALVKLARMKFEVGYPEGLPNAGGNGNVLGLEPNTLFDNFLKVWSCSPGHNANLHCSWE